MRPGKCGPVAEETIQRGPRAVNEFQGPHLAGGARRRAPAAHKHRLADDGLLRSPKATPAANIAPRRLEFWTCQLDYSNVTKRVRSAVWQREGGSGMRI